VLRKVTGWASLDLRQAQVALRLPRPTPRKGSLMGRSLISFAVFELRALPSVDKLAYRKLHAARPRWPRPRRPSRPTPREAVSSYAHPRQPERWVPPPCHTPLFATVPSLRPFSAPFLSRQSPRNALLSRGRYRPCVPLRTMGSRKCDAQAGFCVYIVFRDSLDPIKKSRCWGRRSW